MTKLRGYTLIEMMVVVALLAIIMVAVVGLFLMTLKNGGKAAAIAKVKEEGDYAVTNIERQLRFASNVYQNESMDECASGTADPSNLPQIYFVDSHVPAVGHLIWVNDEGQLVITDYDTNSDRIITSTGNQGVFVENAQFLCKEGGDGVGDMVMFSANFVSNDNDLEQVFTTRVVLRNH